MSLRKRIAAGVAATAVIAGAGIAFAEWTSTAEGTGAAAAGTSADSDISGEVTPEANLYPGALKTITVTISNPNPYPIEVTKIYAGQSKEILGSDSEATDDDCPAGSVLTDESGDGLEALVPVDGSSTDLAIPGRPEDAEETDEDPTRDYTLDVRMIADASDGCKSQTFEIRDYADVEDQLHADVRSAATNNSF